MVGAYERVEGLTSASILYEGVDVKLRRTHVESEINPAVVLKFDRNHIARVQNRHVSKSANLEKLQPAEETA
jgi:hypothetical protein